MLTPEQLKRMREKALEAVADMPEGELKTKAFEVILQHLLSAESQTPANAIGTSTKQSGGRTKNTKVPDSTKSRILLLRDEGYFAVPRTITDIKNELQAHGWVHAMTGLSGPLQGLVRQRELRRIKDQGQKMKVWKYVNP